MRTAIVHSLFGALLVGLLGPQAVRAESEVPVGLMMELSGQFSRLGEDCRKGFQIAKDLYTKDGKAGAHPVRLIFTDNQGSAKGGLTEFRRLVDIEKVQIVLTTRSPVGLAINPLSQRQKIPIFGVVGHPDFVDQNEYAFRAWPSVEKEGTALAKHVVATGARKAAVITLEDDYFLAMGRGFSNELAAAGGKVVYHETVLPGDRDFASLLGKFKEHIDVFFVNLGPAQNGMFIKRLRELGFSQQVVSNFLIGTADALSNAGSAADGTHFVELDFQQPRYLKEIAQRFDGEGASPIGYSCYVSLSTVLTMLSERAASDASVNSASIYELLKGLNEVHLLDGPVRILEREIQFGLKVREIRSGAVERS